MFSPESDTPKLHVFKIPHSTRHAVVAKLLVGVLSVQQLHNG